MMKLDRRYWIFRRMTIRVLEHRVGRFLGSLHVQLWLFIRGKDLHATVSMSKEVIPTMRNRMNSMK